MSLVILVFSAFLLLGCIGIILNKRGRQYDLKTISVAIVARNEEKNLPFTLRSIDKLKYPKEFYEIILVDDCSSDSTLQLFEQFASVRDNVFVVKLRKEEKTLLGKKEGLQKALELARKEIFLLTDADCIFSQNWLNDVSSFWENNTKMVVGYAPEDYSGILKEATLRKKFVFLLRRFSQIATGGVFAATIGLRKPFSCYGRNLAISKEMLLKAGGYKNLTGSQAGDDKQILNLMNKQPGQIRYSPIKNVITYPELKNYKDQQKRRFGKLHMSSKLYLILTVLVIGFFIYLPIRLFVFKDLLSFFVFYFSALLVWSVNLFKHSERFCLLDLVFILIYPYQVIYYTVLGTKGDWQWKS
ncbi:MAG: glycosyltransferase [Candidatus Cloacimonetes bacterium]|nr:glycosyltransferase [Candidatus Cloacimonadota bacterium]